MSTEKPAKKAKSAEKKEKKEKKRKQAEEATGAEACMVWRLVCALTSQCSNRHLLPAADTPSVPEKKQKKAKKSKSSDAEGSDAGAEAPAGAAAPAVEEAVPAAAEAANPLALDNFQLSEPVKSLLRAKGIQSLFDIQAQCLPPLLEGKDLVGRARTGCGKTLAFVLPIVERLAQLDGTGKRAFGRGPSVIVLAPTRELAKQVRRRGEGKARACARHPPCELCWSG
jgi:ATP-dependent RNA helicase DDX21